MLFPSLKLARYRQIRFNPSLVPRRLPAVPGVVQSGRAHFAILQLDADYRLKVTPNRASLYITPIPVNLFISTLVHMECAADGARAFVFADRVRSAAALRRLKDIAAPRHLTLFGRA